MGAATSVGAIIGTIGGAAGGALGGMKVGYEMERALHEMDAAEMSGGELSCASSSSVEPGKSSVMKGLAFGTCVGAVSGAGSGAVFGYAMSPGRPY